MFRKITGALVGGLAGGAVMGALVAWSTYAAFAGALVGGVSFPVAELAAQVGASRLTKGALFGVAFGVAASGLSYVLFSVDAPLVQYASPILAGSLVGGLIWKYFSVPPRQNQPA